jgi:hypothetical protein
MMDTATTTTATITALVDRRMRTIRDGEIIIISAISAIINMNIHIIFDSDRGMLLL